MTLSAEQQFLLGGGGAPSAFTKSDPVGTTVGGPIVEQPELRQQTDFDTDALLFWDDGKPRMQLVVTVQTSLRDPSREDDDGRRRFYIKGNLQGAVRDAVRAAKASSLEVGGTLTVTRSGRDAPKKKGLDGAWLHEATYTPAAQNFLTDPPAQPPTAAPSNPVAAVPPPAATGDVLSSDPRLAHLTPEQLAGARAAGWTAEQCAVMFPATTNA